MSLPLLTLQVHEALMTARRSGTREVECSLDLGRSLTSVRVHADSWEWRGSHYPFLQRCKERTIYSWTGEGFEPVARFTTSLIKLVPTEWGPPTFEIDGIKMLPTLNVSPYEDAQRKVTLIEPHGKTILDTCGGLGYFAVWCLQLGAARIVSYEVNDSVLWLRRVNPWSPEGGGVVDERLTLVHADVLDEIGSYPAKAFDAVLHDPPRFGIAGELYSQQFYDELTRVLKPRGRLFHYVGAPNKLTSGRDVPREVSKRLQRAGFRVRACGDGLVGIRL